MHMQWTNAMQTLPIRGHRLMVSTRVRDACVRSGRARCPCKLPSRSGVCHCRCGYNSDAHVCAHAHRRIRAIWACASGQCPTMNTIYMVHMMVSVRCVYARFCPGSAIEITGLGLAMCGRILGPTALSVVSSSLCHRHMRIQTHLHRPNFSHDVSGLTHAPCSTAMTFICIQLLP